MPTTMTQIAQAAGVSVAVVSRLLRGDESLRISAETRQRVLGCVEQLGGLRQTPRRRRLTRTIAVPFNRRFKSAWVRQLSRHHPLYQALAQTLQAADFALRYVPFDPQQRHTQLPALLAGPTPADGLMLGSGVVDAELAQWLRRQHIAHVVYDHAAERLGVNSVRPHVAAGMHVLVDHLVQLGHRRLAVVGPAGNYRLPLIVAALVAVGLPADNLEVVATANLAFNESPAQLRELARVAFGRWWKRQRTVTAVLGYNDMLALGVLDALAERGLTPGQDVSVAGYDNLEPGLGGSAEQARLTTVDTPFAQLGQRLGELLLNQIIHRQLTIVHEQLPPRLLIRGSTGAPVQVDPAARALLLEPSLERMTHVPATLGLYPD